MRKINPTAIDCTAIQIGQVELARDVSALWLFTEDEADGRLQTWMA